ncbi:MAG: DUF4359 domain-containing protein [Bacteroidales bacterium]|nr:DUF4359 domain-containing protein [Bacteroidales bacterium]
MKYRNFYCSPKYSEGDNTYYGDVAGTPQIPMIYAKNLDDFERLFHEAVDEFLDWKYKKHSHAKWGCLIALLVVIGILIAAILTCPKKDQHVATISDRISSVLNSQLTEESDEFETLGVLLGSALATPIIRNFISVDDYIVCSVGKYTYQGEEQIISLGVFGHVFTVPKERIEETIKSSL